MATPAPAKKKIPTWYWVAGAGAIAAAYFLWQRSKANAAAAAAAQSGSNASGPAGATTPVAAGSYGNAGDLAALLPYLNNMQGAGSTTTGTASNTLGAVGATYTPPVGEPFQGAGFGGVPGSTAVNDSAGAAYEWLPSATAVQAAQANNIPIYYQPTPGVFSKIGPGFTQWANTPIFVQSQAAPVAA